MEGSVTSTQRPFHETIVDAINELHFETPNEEVLRFFQLILRTVIPKNHDAIDQSLRDLGRRLEITLEVVDELEALRELKLKRKEIMVDYRRTLESVRTQKDALILAGYEKQKAIPGPLCDIELTSQEETIVANLDPMGFIGTILENHGVEEAPFE